MEISVSVTNENVWNFLPDDLVLIILSKLPLKSLKQFQCVCKSWSLLFKNPKFMNMFSSNVKRDNHSCHDDTFLVLQTWLPMTPGVKQHCNFYWVSNDKFENWVKLDWPPQFQRNDIDIVVVGSVSINGFLCLRQEFTDSCLLVLWNPTTNEAKLIPPSPVENIPPDRSPLLFLHGFCYDHVTHDYKVIQMIDFFPDEDEDDDDVYEDRSYDPVWEIYSLRNNSWKKLDVDMRHCYHYSGLRSIGLHTDGMFHWWAKPISKKFRQCLLTFEFSSEKLLKTSMPDIDGRFKSRNLMRNLAMLNGSITLFTNYYNKSHPDASSFCISILGKPGVEESWINLFIVGCLPFVEHPIRVGKSNDVFLCNQNARELVWVDLRTQMIGQLATVKGNKLGGCQMGRYKKSFVPIGRINS